jgi:hypothetical protein
MNNDLLAMLSQRESDSLAGVFPVQRHIGNSETIGMFARPIL